MVLALEPRHCFVGSQSAPSGKVGQENTLGIANVHKLTRIGEFINHSIAVPVVNRGEFVRMAKNFRRP